MTGRASSQGGRFGSSPVARLQMQPGRGGSGRIGRRCCCCSCCCSSWLVAGGGGWRGSALGGGGGGGGVCAMGVRRWLLALLLLWLALSPGDGGPLSEASDGKEPGEGEILNLVHPKAVRSAAGRRPNGVRRYRRPRPRLSHKGPMPF